MPARWRTVRVKAKARRKPSTVSLAPLYAKVNKIQRSIRRDAHFFEQISSTTNVSSAGGTLGLIGISIGDSVSNRDGDSIVMQSITIRYRWNLDSTQVANYSHVRIALVLDKQPNGALAGAFDVYNNATFPICTTKSISNNSRFKIMIDRVHDLSKGGPVCVSGTMYKSFYDRTLSVKYDNTAVIPTTNNLLLVFLSDEPTVGEAPEVTCTSMARFTA